MKFFRNLSSTVDMTEGDVGRKLVAFAIPLALGNVFQQLYNFFATLIVGRFVGSSASAAVGSTYSLMTFVNSIIIGLTLGAGIVFSRFYGQGIGIVFKSRFMSPFF